MPKTIKGNGVEVNCLFVGLKLIFNLLRSYFKGVELGYFTKNPAKYHNRKVCDKYKKRQART